MASILQRSRITGNSIQKLLDDKGITARHLANKTQISELHIQEIITGSREAEPEELERIAEFLEVPVRTLGDGSLAGEADNVRLHCMGSVKDPANMTKVLDSIDVYVRLLNVENK